VRHRVSVPECGLCRESTVSCGCRRRSTLSKNRR